MTHFKATNFPLASQMTEFASYRYPECVEVMRTICSRFPEIGYAVNKQIETQRVKEMNKRPPIEGFTFVSTHPPCNGDTVTTTTLLRLTEPRLITKALYWVYKQRKSIP